MKTIGLIGGMSWESTMHYYQLLNEEVNQRLGGLHSAKILLYSIEFSKMEEHQRKNEWDKCTDIVLDAAKTLEQAGADFLLICANTMHKVYEEVQSKISIPILHIADATADELEMNSITRVGLLGTRYTLLEDFYISRLEKRGLKVILPSFEDIQEVNRIIFEELCVGRIEEASQIKLIHIINQLKEWGAQGIILGCTELDMLIDDTNSSLPVFDTTLIHALKAIQFAMEE